MTNDDFRRIALKVQSAKKPVTDATLRAVVGPADYDLITRAREDARPKPTAATTPAPTPVPPNGGTDQ
jgi:hypothetical protein